jgi:transcriptional regulator with XRE-family HTH domain
MSNFSKRLLEFMADHNLTAKSLAERLGVSHTCIGRYINEERTPNFSCFIDMLYLFNCSADYLLGLTDLHTEEPLHRIPPFSEQLQKILKERKITQAKLIRDLHISSAVPYKWLSGINEPSVESLISLAKYFECTVDYLIGRVR